MKNWIQRVCLKVLAWTGWKAPVQQVVLSDLPLALQDAAMQWVKKWDENRTVSGEHKRHQVYARLLKEFPELPAHLCGSAIEVAVRRLRGQG